MKHKLALAILAAVILIDFGACVQSPSNTESLQSSETIETSSQPSSDDEYRKVAYVDERIDQLMKSSAYKNSSFEKQKELIFDMLKELERERYIINLYYNEESLLFSFEYSNGTLGGVSLRDFHQEIDGLPIN